MESAMIGKIEKAKRYAEEREERIVFEEFNVTFKGENSDHRISFKEGKFTCTCNFFHSHEVCSHTMAIERILGKMIKVEVTAEEEPVVE